MSPARRAADGHDDDSSAVPRYADAGGPAGPHDDDAPLTTESLEWAPEEWFDERPAPSWSSRPRRGADTGSMHLDGRHHLDLDHDPRPPAPASPHSWPEDLEPEEVPAEAASNQHRAHDARDMPPHRTDRAPSGFAASLGWTALEAVFPGLGFLPTRFRRAGLALFTTGVVALVVLGAVAVVRLSSVAVVAVQPGSLRLLGFGAIAMGLLLSGLIALVQVHTRPSNPTALQRTLGSLVVAVLSFMVSAPLIVGAGYARSQASLVNGVFKLNSRSQTRPDLGEGDVWKNKTRLNVLLLGADSTEARNRHGDGIRTDTIMVASIDTATGDTVLFQIPRNMARMPFPEGSELAAAYPDGFYGGNADMAEYFANAVYQNVPHEHPELFSGTDYPGADALKLGLGATLGLDVDYFMMVNIDGLTRLIDAMGGVRLNVNSRIPVAGDSEGRPSTGWIEPGPDKLLNGYYAMWYARSRKGSTDYNRMGRQTCVVKAVIDQADPGTMLTRYEGIAQASKEMVMTDIPQDVLSPLVQLTLRVKDGHVRRVLFVHQKDGFDTTDPDFDMMRARVQKALQEAKEQPATAPTRSAAPVATAASSAPADKATPTATEQPSEASTGGAPTSTAGTPSATPTVESENVSDACAYNPMPEQP